MKNEKCDELKFDDEKTEEIALLLSFFSFFREKHA